MPEVKRFKLIPKDDIDTTPKIRSLLTDDPVASRCLVYVYLNEPASVTEIVNSITQIENIVYDRSTIWRKLKLLKSLGLIVEIPIAEIANESKTNSELHKKVKIKWKQISKRHENNQLIYKKLFSMSFFAVTPKGEEFLDWAIEKHNLPFELRRIK